VALNVVGVLLAFPFPPPVCGGQARLAQSHAQVVGVQVEFIGEVLDGDDVGHS